MYFICVIITVGCLKMNKAQLRNDMLDKMKQINIDEKKHIEQTLMQHLFHTSMWKEARTVGVTVSSHLEWDTYSIMKEAWREKKIIAVPKCYPVKKQLYFYQINSFSDLHPGYADIMEPIVEQTKQMESASIELLIVPGVLFDSDGYRIGFGGGYYDRFLKTFSNLTVSLVSEKQILPSIPKEQHDVPVQYLITEKGCIKV